LLDFLSLFQDRTTPAELTVGLSATFLLAQVCDPRPANSKSNTEIKVLGGYFLWSGKFDLIGLDVTMLETVKPKR
jgi:hypothetical protein